MGLPLPKTRGMFDRVSIAGREIAAFAKQAMLLRRDVGQPVLPTQARAGDDVVVCLHGLFATAGVLRPLRRRLERHERIHTATMTFRPGPGVKVLARQLAELVADLPQGVRVHLIGHSLGGVVARWFAQEHDDPRVVQTISMAAPFAGVHNVAWLGFDVARDLDPRSPLLRQLRLGSQRALGTPHLSLVAEHDQVVKAPMAHALPGGEVTLVRNCGHNAMLYHDEVSNQVERRVLAFAQPSW